jgi:hypothetical protein
VNPPGNFVWKGQTTDKQIRRYATLCSKDTMCSARTEDPGATIRRVNGDIPERWGFLPIDEGNVRVATFWGRRVVDEATGPISAPVTIDAWISADKGDASGFWFQSLLSELAFPQSFIWGEMAARASADDWAAERYFSSRDRGTILGSPGTEFIWGGGQLADAWPAPAKQEYDRVRTSKVETLLIGGELDFATPPQVATRELLPYLPNGKEVVIPALGHSGSFWAEQPEVGTRLINNLPRQRPGGQLALRADERRLLDIAWDRQVRDRFAANPRETLEARPSTG